MKKSIILIISVITLISVVVVAFFGVKAANISPVVYITKIELLDMDGNLPYDDGGENENYNYNNIFNKLLKLKFEPDLYDEETDTYYMQYFFNVRLNYYDENNDGKSDEDKVPTREDILYSVESEYINIPTDVENAAKKGAILIKEKKESETEKIVTMAQITCKANEGGNASDYLTILVNYN